MNRKPYLFRQYVRRAVTATMALALAFGAGAIPVSHARAALSPSAASCQLDPLHHAIQHVIYVQFDNTHFTRDNPNVPSDLEQMPHLLNFITQNGTLLTNHHTPLIAHTATDILTSLTGVYPDHHGVPISNSFRYFNPDGTSNLGVSFAYWTDPIFDPTTNKQTDTSYNMLTATGRNAPAPWVPYTRAGCDVGSVATANTVLENTATDIPTVFGPNSPQAQEVASNPGQAFADFVGIAVHCAQGDALCSSANQARPDVLPNEPGGYNGYMGLFGHKYVAPLISPNGPLTDLNGNVIQDAHGHIGFPGFDGMPVAVSLGYVAAMQEHDIPVTYAYITAPHQSLTTGAALGPGDPTYVAQLKADDNAFDTFFTRLASDGINQSNTLFVFTADEGDHLVSGPPSPASCDGVTTPCTYSQFGEVNGNLAGLLATQQSMTTPFKVHSDAAPNFYVTGNPAPAAALTRNVERAVGNLTALNPYSGQTEKITNYLADPVEMKLLHMVTSDPNRTPTFTLFAKPDYFLYAGAPNCGSPCITLGPNYAWNHGDVAPEINTTWLGLVGPGVQPLGQVSSIWTDHTDTRTTMMALLGLHDDYIHDGRVIFEIFQTASIPRAMLWNIDLEKLLGNTYKQIEAPVGELGLASLRVSTAALVSNAPGDATYTTLENQIAALGRQRDLVGGLMSTMLDNAEFNGQPIDAPLAHALVNMGNYVIEQMQELAEQYPLQ